MIHIPNIIYRYYMYIDIIYIYGFTHIYIYVINIYIYINYQHEINVCIYTWKTVRTIFLSVMGFARYGCFFLFNCVCWFLIVMRCSDPLMTPGSDILRQSPKEEFQHKMEQVGSHDRVPKSGNKYCHISHQIWMYSKNTNIFSTSC